MNLLRTRHKEYLNHNLNLFFVSYPSKYFGEVFDAYWIFKDQLLDDIYHWYPKYRSIINVDNYLNYLQVSSNFEALFYYRISNTLFKESGTHELLPFIAALMKYKSGAEVYYSTNIGKRFMIQHAAGVVIGPRCEIGDEFIIFQGCTIGQQHDFSPNENAEIGNKVRVYAGAKILGKVQIDNNVWVGANAVVTKDCEANSIYAGIPATKIKNLK